MTDFTTDEIYANLRSLSIEIAEIAKERSPDVVELRKACDDWRLMIQLLKSRISNTLHRERVLEAHDLLVNAAIEQISEGLTSLAGLEVATDRMLDAFGS